MLSFGLHITDRSLTKLSHSPGIMTVDPHTIASTWLAAFASAVEAGNIDTLTKLFLPDGWLRDLLVSTWDNRSLEGREKIRTFLSTTLLTSQLSDIKLSETAHLAPRTSFIAQIQTADVEFAFNFECAHGHGQGYARLIPDQDGDHKAFTVLLALCDLHGHEESKTLVHREDLTGVPDRNMQEEFASWVEQVETKPYVLIGMLQARNLPPMDVRLFNIPSGCGTNRRAACRPLQADGHTYAGHRT